MKKNLILYSTAGCHLCEHAKALVLPLLHNSSCDLLEVDIADSDELMARYGMTIPVLSDSSDQHQPELNWPFTEETVREWLLRIEA